MASRSRPKTFFRSAIRARLSSLNGVLAVEGMQHDAFEQVAKGQIVEIGERLQHLQQPLLHAYAGLHAFDDGPRPEFHLGVTLVSWYQDTRTIGRCAVHNHFFFETPRIFFMHVHGIGSASDLAAKIKPAIDLIGKTSASIAKGTGTALPTGLTRLPKLAAIVGHEGEQNGPVYKITIGRDDIDVREHGARIDARMGLNTWAAFAGSDAEAVVAGIVAMKAGEVTRVLKALRGAGIQVVALHHHMTGEPTVFFVHYWGRARRTTRARVRSAVDQLGK